MTKKLVSVIVPVYNQEKHIRQCIGSLLSQDYPVFEIIVVDNNSSDRTKQVIDRLKRNNAVKYYFEPNLSRGAARNTGIKNSKGEVLIMLDGDCIVPRDWIKNMVLPIIKGNETVVVGEWRYNPDSKLFNNYHQNFIKKSLKHGYLSYLDTKCCAFKKEVIEKIGNFDSGLLYCEDIDLGLRLQSNNYNLFYQNRSICIHNHKFSIFGWIVSQSRKSYWKLVVLNRKNVNKGRMGIREFFMFFIEAPMDLVLNISNTDLFFNIITGISWRLGIMKYYLSRIIFH